MNKYTNIFIKLKIKTSSCHILKTFEKSHFKATNLMLILPPSSIHRLNQSVKKKKKKNPFIIL